MNRLYINKDWSTLKKLIAIKAAGGGGAIVEHTVTGNPATFETNVIAPMELLIPFTPVQDLHGQGSPYPAGGGKNLFDKAATGNELNKYLNASTGALVNSGSNYDTSDYIKITAGVTYTASGFSVTGSTEVCFYDESKVFIPGSGIQSNNHTFTAPTGAVYLRFDYKHADLDVMQLEVGSSASSYAPYENLCPISGWTGAEISHSGADTSTPTVYAITFPDSAGTIYGGTLTVNKDGTWTLVATHKMWTADGNTPWTVVDEGTADVSFYSQAGYGFDVKTSDDNGYSNYFKYRYSFNTRGTIMAYSNRININKGSGFTSVAELQAAFAQTPLQVLYPLATPVEIDLTDSDAIVSLLGVNNVWSDTNGENTVKYMKKG